MKIALLSASLKKDLFLRMSDFLSGLTIEASAVILSPRWSLDQHKPLEAILSRSDGFIVLADPGALSSTWMVYLMGCLREERERIIFYGRTPASAWPGWLKGLTVCRDFLSLRDHLLAAQEDWETRIAVRLAHKNLAAMGIDRSSHHLIRAVMDSDRLLTGMFLEAGFSPHLKNDRGVPLLGIAARSGSLTIVQALLAAGADVNQPAEDRGTTPLMDAAAAGHDDLVVYLTERGATLEHRSRDGQTALLLAVGNQRIKSAKYLLTRGADPLACDQLGMDSLKYARLFHEEELLALLSESAAELK